MRKSVVLITAGVILWVLAVGCAGSGGDAVAPEINQNITPTVQVSQPNTCLWGFYDVYFDPETKTIEATVNRQAMFAANVVTFLNGNPAALQFTILSTTPGTGYIDIDINVGITHPFPGLPQYNGYDVRGIFIGDNSSELRYGSSLGYAVNGTDQYLKNADGYTRWFNPGEFIYPGLAGYTPGDFATPGYKGSAAINPYKYFADGLSPTGDVWTFLTGTSNNGVFSTGRTNYRQYRIRFPNSTGVRYNYSIVANWESESTHPANAPEAVGCDIVNNSTVFYESSEKKGGDIILDISLFGRDNQPSQIYIDTPLLSTLHAFTPAEMVPVETGEHYATYHIEIPATNVNGTQSRDLWVIAQYDDCDYTSTITPSGPGAAPDAPLAAFFRYTIAVSNQSPAWIEVLTPNGGEEWLPGEEEEITWDSGYVEGNVLIEYSPDDFTSEILTIAPDEPNDGSFTWAIPCAYSDTGLIRVSSIQEPDINDVSDDYFSIVETGWAETWGGTGTDRVAAVGVDSDGNSYSCGVAYIPSNQFDAFLRCYDPCSDELWEVTWGDSGIDWGEDVVVDSQGYAYVTGRFEGTVDFDPGSGTDNHASNGGYDCFLCKFDSSGEFQWALTWGGSGGDGGQSVCLDDSGNAYVTGYFSTTADFDPDGGSQYTSNGSEDIFLSKFNSSGDFTWVQIWGGSEGDIIAYHTATDESGNIHCTGDFRNTVEFAPVDPPCSNTSDEREAVGYDDGYVLKHMPDGCW